MPTSVDDLQPLCRMSSNDVLRIIQKSGGHQVTFMLKICIPNYSTLYLPNK